jgi:phenylacetic acid degradation operon negative regulatory protein
VRTAISRMVSQDWLEPVEIDSAPGYQLTARAQLRLDQAAARIYRTGDLAWDGQWHMRVLAPIAERSRRERVRSQLRFLGMAPISDSTWVSPRHAVEVDQLLRDEGLAAVTLTGARVSPLQVLLDAFDVTALATDYEEWLTDAANLIASASGSDDVAAFVVRSELLHSWRKFLFSDPGLPASLLPADWPGRRAAAFFDEHATRLLPATNRFIDRCLTPTEAGART